MARTPARALAVGRERALVAAAMLGGLLLRVAYLLHQRGEPGYRTPTPGLDADLYHGLALRVAAGDLALGERVYHYAPLPAYVQGLVYAALGPDMAWMRWLHVILGVACIGLLFSVGRRIAGSSAGLAAAWLGALYAPLVVYDTQPLPAAQGNLALLAGVAVLLGGRQSLARCALAGVLLGLAAAIRSNLLLMMPVCAVWLLWPAASPPLRRRVALAAVLTLGTCAPLSLFAARNLAVSGEWALITSSAGIHVYIGNQPGSRGTYWPLPRVRQNPAGHQRDAKLVAEQAVGRELGDMQVSAWFLGEAARLVRERPGDALRVAGRKLRLGVNRFEPSNNLYLPYLYRGWPPLQLLPGFAVVGVLGLLGLALSIRRQPLVPLLALSYLLTLVIVFVNARYRLPFALLLIPLAGAASVWIARALGRALALRSASPLLRPAIAVAALGTLVGWDASTPAIRRGELDWSLKQARIWHARAELEARAAAAGIDGGARAAALLELARLRESAGDWEGALRLAREASDELPGVLELVEYRDHIQQRFARHAARIAEPGSGEE